MPPNLLSRTAIVRSQIVHSNNDFNKDLIALFEVTVLHRPPRKLPQILHTKRETEPWRVCLLSELGQCHVTSFLSAELP